MADTEIAQAKAELDATIAEMDALTDYDDPAFEEAEHQFDESPERQKVNGLLSDLLDKVGKQSELAKVVFDLDNAIADLIPRTEEYVLGRIVIGIAHPGGLPCVGHWSATRPTEFDPVEHTRKVNGRIEARLKEQGLI